MIPFLCAGMKYKDTGLLQNEHRGHTAAHSTVNPATPFTFRQLQLLKAEFENKTSSLPPLLPPLSLSRASAFPNFTSHSHFLHMLQEMTGFLLVLPIPYRELREQVRALPLGAVPRSRLL